MPTHSTLPAGARATASSRTARVPRVASTLLAAAGLLLCTNLEARTLTLEQRIASQRAIEQVYWNHRNWPEQNPGAKPALSSVLPHAQIRARVEDHLIKSQALESVWQRRITHAELQAEIDRMAANTHAPAMLAELFEALGNDPFLIAEVLVRPNLTEERIRTAFADDPRFPTEAAPSFDTWWTGQRASTALPEAADAEPYRLPDIATTACTFNTWGQPLSTTGNVPTPRTNCAAVWTGSEMIVWGGQGLNSGGRYDPATDTWGAPTSTSGNVPSGSNPPVAVWSGTEMLVWGGYGGGRYNPTTDTWGTPISTSGNTPYGKSGASAVWTGTEMIVWGGAAATVTNTGGRYNPVTNSWGASTSTAGNIAVPRTGHSAVWTGSEMIVWGGTTETNGNGGYQITGGRYDPVTDTWGTPTSTGANVAPARAGHAAVWTGNEMIVWGGFCCGEHGGNFNSGARYSPDADSWLGPISLAGEPSWRVGMAAVWTGSEMLVWGGYSGWYTGNTYLADGGRYCGLCSPTRTVYRDADSDGYGGSAAQICGASSTPSGWVDIGGDCDDANPGAHPGATELACNGFDDNCDGVLDEVSSMSFAARAQLSSVSSPVAVAIGDLNGDTNPDLIATNYGTHTISRFLGDGFGGYSSASQFAVGIGPRSVATGDVNGDGKLDVATANTGNTVSVLLGNGSGGFGPTTNYTTTSARSVSIGDVNGDSQPDLVSTSDTDNMVSVRFGDGVGGFGTATAYPTGVAPYSVAIGDVSGDGYPDLVTANHADSSVSVLLGNGAGTFGSAMHFTVGKEPYSVAIENLDAGADLDLAVANEGSGTVSILLGSGGGAFAPRTDVPVGSGPRSVAIADLSGDGKSDVVVANTTSLTISILLGHGNGLLDGRLDISTGSGPVAVAVADLNRDGRRDLAVALPGVHTISTLLGDANGAFGSTGTFASGVNPRSLALADVNADGLLDAVTSNEGSDSVSVLLGLGGGGFGSRVDFAVNALPRSLALGDVNGDGKPDLATANFNSNSVSVLFGDGAGGFGGKKEFVTPGPLAVAIGDVNGDTKLDLIATSDVFSPAGFNTVTVRLGNGLGAFGVRTGYPTGTTPASVAVGDVNGDGFADFVTSNTTDNTVSVLLGNGSGSFGTNSNYALGSSPNAVAISNLNGDANPDLVVSNFGANSVSVLLGTGGGGFGPRLDVAVGAGPYSVAAADLSGDGKVDLAVANYISSTVSVLLGNGDGTFGGRTDFCPGGSGAASVVIGDLNGDGRKDVVVANHGSNNVARFLNVHASIVAVEPDARLLPSGFELFAPRPNPTSDAATIVFVLPEAARVRAEIFDAAGRRVARIANEQRMDAGRHSLLWDGHGRSGARLESGIYYVRLTSGSNAATRPLVLLTP